MRRLWVCLFVCLLAVSASAGQKRFGRIVAAVGGSSADLAESDFTSLGGFRVPETISTSWGANLEASYGEGLALKYESGDSGNLHFIALGYGAAYDAGTCANCNVYTLYQMRVPALSTPGSPLTFSNWTSASTTGSKTYPGPPVYPGSGHGSHRLLNDMGDPNHPMQQHSTGKYGLFNDAVDNRLYELYSYGYGADCADWSMHWTSLDYATPANSTSEGPWSFTGIGQKSTGGWMARLPTSWVATNTPGKPLVIGSGAMTSQVSQCDVSAGPSGVAFAAPAGGLTQQTALANTPLVGYYPLESAPGAGKGRMTRATSVSFGGRTPFYSDYAWGATKQTEFDFIEGCAIVDPSTTTGGKGGLVCINRQGEGQCNYANGTLPCTYYRDYLVIYSLNDLAAVAADPSLRYVIQPVAQWEVQWPEIDYTKMPHALVSKCTGSCAITSITATAGSKTDGSSGALPIVTTATAHNLSVGQYAAIVGTSQTAQYDANWVVNATPSSTTFTIYNTSDGASTFSGASASGGTVYDADGSRPNSTGPRGIAYDGTTKRVYVAMAVFQSATGQGRGLFIHGFQLP